MCAIIIAFRENTACLNNQRIVIAEGKCTFIVADHFAFFIANSIVVSDRFLYFDIFKLADAFQLVFEALAGFSILFEFLPSLLKITFFLRNQEHLMLSCQDNLFQIALRIKDFFEFVRQDYFVVLQNPK